MKMPMIQIAGVKSQHEADMLVECGVKHIGFPLRLPVHKEDITEPEAASIIKNLPNDVEPILITYIDKKTEVIELCDYLAVNNVQLHGDICLPEIAALKEERPNFYIIKSLVIGEGPTEELFQIVKKYSQYVDAFITDTYDSSTGASGATGLTHDWKLSRELVSAAPKPVILAGGLTPENVIDAILAVRPAGVDSHTGVEDPDGNKSRLKVEAFLSKSLQKLVI